MSRNNEEVERYLENNLEKVTEADPKTLIPYILALIHKPKNYCIEQLRDFLHEETESFVNKLFDFLSTLPKSKKSKEHRHEKDTKDKEKDKDKEKKRKHHHHHHDEDSKRRKKEGKLKDERKHGDFYQGEDSITLVGGSERNSVELSNVVDSHQQNTIPVSRRLPVGLSYPYIQHPQSNLLQPQIQTQQQQVLAAPSVFQPQIIRTIPMVSGSTPQPILVMHNGQPTYILPAPLPQSQPSTPAPTQVQSQPQQAAAQSSSEITGHEGHRNTVLVKNIPLECNNIAKLSAHFERFGVVLNIRVHHASKTALVTFQNGYEAQAAINAPDAVCGNRFISTQWAPLEKRQVNRQYHKSDSKHKYDADATGQPIKSAPTETVQNQQELEKHKLREERFRKEKELEAEKLKLLEAKRAEAVEKMKSLQVNKEQNKAADTALQQLLDKKRATVEAALEKVKKRFAELEQNPSLATPEEKTHLMKQIKELGFALRSVALQKQNVISFT